MMGSCGLGRGCFGSALQRYTSNPQHIPVEQNLPLVYLSSEKTEGVGVFSLAGASEFIRGLAAAVAIFSFGAAADAQVTYSYVSPTYAGVAPHTAGDCSAVGGCVDYSIGQSVVGSITLATPLAPNLSDSLVPATSVVEYSFSDGVNTISSSEPGARLYGFQVSTDASGVITSAVIEVQEWRDGLPPDTREQRHRVIHHPM
jgi:hypothetical protein